MKCLYIKSKKHHSIKVINLKLCYGVGYDKNSKSIYATFDKPNGTKFKETIVQYPEYSEELIYKICEKFFEQYIDKSTTSDTVCIDMDEIIQEVQQNTKNIERPQLI